MYSGLQAARGIAALLVIVHHATLSSGYFYGPAFDNFWLFGNIGVDFFFVLSGFIIYHAHQNNPTGFDSWRSYILKRIIRIYPPFLLVSISLLIMYAAFPQISLSGKGEISLLSSLLLIPSEHSPALPVSWTLMNEMLFYILFSVFFIQRTLLIAVLTAWCSAIIIYQFMAGGHYLLNFFFTAHNLQFLLGLGVAYLYTKERAHTRATLCAGLLMICGFAVYSYIGGTAQLLESELVTRLALGSGFALIVWGLCGLDDLYKPEYPKILLLMGAASYSIYLVHLPVLSVFNRIAAYVVEKAPLANELLFSAVVLMSLIAGVVYYFICEKPMLEHMKKIWTSKRVIAATFSK